MRTSERILVWRLKRGDREACRELIARHHAGVYGYLRHLGADHHRAEDLTQETYARAWRDIGALREAASLRSWLLTIARNEFLQEVRAGRPEVTALEEVPDRPTPERGPRDPGRVGARPAAAPGGVRPRAAAGRGGGAPLLPGAEPARGGAGAGDPRRDGQIADQPGARGPADPPGAGGEGDDPCRTGISKGACGRSVAPLRRRSSRTVWRGASPRSPRAGTATENREGVDDDPNRRFGGGGGGGGGLGGGALPRSRRSDPGWAEVLRPVAEASGQAGAVHMLLSMLTAPGEDFSYVNLRGKLEKVEAWVRWPRAGDAGRSRVEKGDRIYVFDGRETIGYRPGQHEAWRRSGGEPDLDLFWPAAWLENLIAEPADGAEVVAREEADGRGRLLLRWKGAVVEGRPKAFFEEFDREVEVTWDLATRRLTGFRRWVLPEAGERLLFSELISVEYLPDLEEALFHLDLPEDVRWSGLAEAPAGLPGLGPRETAERFWQAAIAGDWPMVEALCPSPSAVDFLKELRPAELISLGEPFRTGRYAGVYVPYRVRLADGALREHNLALRNDNPQGRWVYDGGM